MKNKMNLKNLLKGLVMGVMAMGLILPAARADFETVGHSVTVSVPEVLSITADTAEFTLTFANHVSGSESDEKTVVYTVESNDMGQADGETAMNANLDILYEQVDFKAKVGAYTKVSGNTELAAVNGDFVTVGTSNVAIANKANTTAGSDGRLLNGTIPITYKAVATEDMKAGNQTHLLFITLTTR